MLDGDEAATDTAVSQFRNSSPILMRPVYFPAILCLRVTGLPLCNYILIPPAQLCAARVSSRLFAFGGFASFSLRLPLAFRVSRSRGFPACLFVIVINLIRAPVIFLSLYVKRTREHRYKQERYVHFATMPGHRSLRLET